MPRYAVLFDGPYTKRIDETMSTLESQISEAERRSRDRAGRVAKNEVYLQEGRPFLAD